MAFEWIKISNNATDYGAGAFGDLEESILLMPF